MIQIVKLLHVMEIDDDPLHTSFTLHFGGRHTVSCGEASQACMSALVVILLFVDMGLELSIIENLVLPIAPFVSGSILCTIFSI